MADHRNVHPPATGELAGGYTINTNMLVRRLKSLYSHWWENRDQLWGSSNVFAVATPPLSDDVRYLKSSALNIWLLGYEFPETIMVFTDKQIHLLCSQKKAPILEVVKESAKDAISVDVVMHVKAAKSDDGSNQMDAILRAIKSQNATPVVGHIAKEALEGKFLERWAEKLKWSGLKLTDVSNGLADLFAVKEAGKIRNVKKAAYLTASAMIMFVVPRLKKVIDEEMRVTHSSLMDDTKKVILEPNKMNVMLKTENVDICYPPIFQSGGNFDLRPSASSNDDHLYYDSASVIICALGSRHNGYCANVARTFLIDSSDTQSKAYQVLLKAHEAAVGALKPGNKACDVYKAALSVVKREAPELIANLTKSAGMGIGLEFHESGLSLNEKNERILKAGMVLNVSLGFQNLHTESKNKKSQNYALLLADTVIVTSNDHEAVTSLSSKAFRDVAYSFNKSKEEDARPQVTPEKGMIMVDERYEVVFIPIEGSMIPFHVATIKNVSIQPDTSQNCHIQFIFNVPETPVSSHNPNSLNNELFVKEISFRSKDPRRVSEVVQQIETLKRNVVSRESRRSERASLVPEQ